MIARRLRAMRPKPHTTWHLDEMFVSIGGKWMYLWRAVDGEGEVLDCLISVSPGVTSHGTVLPPGSGYRAINPNRRRRTGSRANRQKEPVQRGDEQRSARPRHGS